MTGRGRFALARNSPLVQTFFGENVLDIAHLINGYDPTWVEPDGSYRLAEQQMAELYGVEYYGITVSNRKVTDGYDDYAERTFIWGGTKFKLSDDGRFVIDSQGNRYIDNMAIVRDGDDNFNFEGTDIVTNTGNIALEHAIYPSGIGSTLSLVFEEYDPESYTYTILDFDAELVREQRWAQPTDGELLNAMQSVVDELWSNGVTRFLHGDKPIIYGIDGDDTLAESFAAPGYDLEAPSSFLGLVDLNLHEYVQNGIVYQAGVGNDAVFGTSGDDVAYGGDGNDMLDGFEGDDIVIGGTGADSLFGGGADDFIFFDFADGSNVYGGAGRDVAVALGSDGVTVDMAAQGLECVIGCDGADTILVTEADQPVFAAGGGGADHFILDNLDTHGPRILWGGAGADVFNFQNGGRVSLAVVNIDGLTEEAFSRLTLADLGLGNIDLSLLSAIIINPDATHRFYMDDTLLGTSAVNLGDWSRIGDDPDLLAHLVPGYSSPVSFGVRTSDYLWDNSEIQAVYDNEVRVHHQVTFNYNFFDITVWSNGDYGVVQTDNYVEHWIQDLNEAIDDALMSAELMFEQYDEYGYGWATSEYGTLQELSTLPTGPFLVVGGQFDGNSLVANGDLVGSLPDIPGPSPIDWLLAA